MMDLNFHNISVSIKDREILKDVWGGVLKGEMLAIMGPSGSGKSTLLGVLAHRMKNNKGSVTLNGRPICKQIARKIEFVLQKDVFLPKLTLKETLTFAALLSLPDKLSRKAKLQRVKEIIELLELEKCIDTKMGDASTPGLSGGERKRAAIGCAIMADPLVLLLDEPTSGLDYSIASKLVNTLNTYTSVYQRAVVATIHQPSSHMFHLFSNVLLLADGQVAYFGPTAGILEHFCRVGLKCMPHYNPADFIVEELRASKENQSNLIKAAKECSPNSTNEDGSASNYFINPAFETESSNGCARTGELTANTNIRKEERIEDIRKGHSESSNDCTSYRGLTTNTEVQLEEQDDMTRKWPACFMTQYTALTRRLFKHHGQNIFSKTTITLRIIVCVYIILIWWQLERSEKSMNDRLGAIYFLTNFWGFESIIFGAMAFHRERAVFERERAAGLYRLSAYWLAKQTSELPLLLCMPLFFATAFYWGIGFTANPWLFILFLVDFQLYVFAMQSVGVFISVIVNDLITAVSAAKITMFFSILSSGYLKRDLDHVWVLRYFSFTAYIYEGTTILDLTYGQDFKCDSVERTQFMVCRNQTLSNATSVGYISGDEILQDLGFFMPVWATPLVLLGILLFFSALSYLTLRFYRKPARQY